MVESALPVPDEDAYVSYPVTTSSAGPFIISFPLPPDWEDALKCRVGGADGDMVTAFTFTPDSQVGAGYPAGEATLDVAVEDTTVEFWRDTPIERTDDYAAGPLDFDTFNAELTRQAMMVQDQRLYSRRLETEAGDARDEAVDAATEAAASALAADASADAADASATAAAASASAANTSSNLAAGFATAAAGDAFTASAAATAASASATTATTQATNAAASATSASGSATTASAAATAAATAETNAETAETNAEAAADAAEQANAGALWLFSTNTASSDPGAGNVKFNHATPASVTAVYISETDGYGASVSALLATIDDSTSTARAYLIFRKRGAPSSFIVLTVTAALTDNGGWDTFTVTHVSSNGAFAAADELTLSVWRVGDTGPAGAGSGDVNGPASAGADKIALFDGATGKLIKDSGKAHSTDGTLATNSDALVPTEKAVKTYADTALALKAPLASPALTGNPTAPTQSQADNSTKISTTAYVDAAVGAIIAAADAMVFKGVIDCSANPNYPAADRGHTYKVSVAGKIGGGSGPNVEAGELLLCITDGTIAGTHAGVGAAWVVQQVNIDGAVTGPASSVNNRVAIFSGTTGKIIADSGLLLSGSNTGDQTITLTGDVTGTGTGSFAATIGANKVTDAMIRQSAGVSVPGRSANSTGNVADIVASANDQVLQRVGNALTWAGITIGMIADGLITYAKLATAAVGTAAEFWANTASKLVSVAGVWSAADPVTITFSTTLTLDFATFINGKVTLTNNTTLQTPTNMKKGQCGCIELIQDGTGTRTMNSSNAGFVWAGGTDGVLSTAINTRDLLYYQILDDDKVFLSLTKAVA